MNFFNFLNKTTNSKSNKHHRIDMLLLAEFLEPRSLDKSAKYWPLELKNECFSRLISNGDLIQPSVKIRIDTAFKVEDLKNFLKKSGEKISGKKQELIERLIEVNCVEVINASNGVYQCSVDAVSKYKRWEFEDQQEGRKSIENIVELLSKRHVETAQKSVKIHNEKFLKFNFSTFQKNPFAIEVDAKKEALLIEEILKSNPRICSDISASDLESARLAAALLVLGCVSNYGVYENLIENIYSVRFLKRKIPNLIHHYANTVCTIKSCVNLGGKNIPTFIAKSSATNCLSCASLDGRVFSINELPEIPNPQCERDGCYVHLRVNWNFAAA